MSALERERQEGIGPGRARPGLVIEAGDPEGVERQARGLEHAEDLDGCGRALRLVGGACGHAAKKAEGLAAGELASDDVQAGKPGEQLVEGPGGLVFRAGECALAGPAQGGQQAREIAAPAAGGLPVWQ